jgi:prepilin-type N-terminal cleavage/methylation domain-containing protein
MNARAARSAPPTRRVRRDARGDTLIEVLLAVLIIGIASTAVLLTFSEGVAVSGTHRRLSTTDVDARTYAERLASAIDSGSLAYVACAGTNVYASPPGFTPLAGDSVTVTTVSYWNGTAFSSSCTPSTDLGIQRLAVTVANTNGAATRPIQVIVRKRCSLTDVTAGPCT